MEARELSGSSRLHMDGPEKARNGAGRDSTWPSISGRTPGGDDAGVHGNEVESRKGCEVGESQEREISDQYFYADGAREGGGGGLHGLSAGVAMVFSLAQPPRPLEKQPQDACLTSLFRVSGSRALKHTKIPAPVGRNGQVHRRQSTPRLVGVIAHFTSPPTHPEVTQPPELPRGPRPPRPPPLKNGRRNNANSIHLPCLSVRPLDRGQGKTSSGLTLNGHI